MLRHSIERHILRPTFAANAQLTSPAKLRFHPKRVALDFDSAYASFLQDLRDRGDLSRESILEEIDYSQEVEFRRQREADRYDDTFQTVNPWGGGAGRTGRLRIRRLLVGGWAAAVRVAARLLVLRRANLLGTLREE